VKSPLGKSACDTSPARNSSAGARPIHA
jgi:hypothetical protein